MTQPNTTRITPYDKFMAAVSKLVAKQSQDQLSGEEKDKVQNLLDRLVNADTQYPAMITAILDKFKFVDSGKARSFLITDHPEFIINSLTGAERDNAASGIISRVFKQNIGQALQSIGSLYPGESVLPKPVQDVLLQGFIDFTTKGISETKAPSPFNDQQISSIGDLAKLVVSRFDSEEFTSLMTFYFRQALGRIALSHDTINTQPTERAIIDLHWFSAGTYGDGTVNDKWIDSAVMMMVRSFGSDDDMLTYAEQAHPDMIALLPQSLRAFRDEYITREASTQADEKAGQAAAKRAATKAKKAEETRLAAEGSATVDTAVKVEEIATAEVAEASSGMGPV